VIEALVPSESLEVQRESSSSLFSQTTLALPRLSRRRPALLPHVRSGLFPLQQLARTRQPRQTSPLHAQSNGNGREYRWPGVVINTHEPRQLDIRPCVATRLRYGHTYASMHTYTHTHIQPCSQPSLRFSDRGFVGKREQVVASTNGQPIGFAFCI